MPASPNVPPFTVAPACNSMASSLSPPRTWPPTVTAVTVTWSAPARPDTLPARLKSIVKTSTPAPPVRFSTLVKPLAESVPVFNLPVREPVLSAVRSKALPSLSPISVSLSSPPSIPPESDPVSLTENVSPPTPPLSSSTDWKVLVTPPTIASPLSDPVMLNVSAASPPSIRSLFPPPLIVAARAAPVPKMNWSTSLPPRNSPMLENVADCPPARYEFVAVIDHVAGAFRPCSTSVVAVVEPTKLLMLVKPLLALPAIVAVRPSNPPLALAACSSIVWPVT